MTHSQDSHRSHHARRQCTAAALVVLASVGWARQVGREKGRRPISIGYRRAPTGSDDGNRTSPLFCPAQIHPTVRRAFAFTHGRGAFVIACRSGVECDDQDTGNGAETCDVESGRCQTGIAPPTASPTATASAPVAITATPSVIPTSTPTGSPTVTARPTASATRSPTPVPPQTRTVTPTAAPTRAHSNDGDGCSMTPGPRADAAAGVVWFWLAPLLWRAGVTRFLRKRDHVRGARPVDREGGDRERID